MLCQGTRQTFPRMLARLRILCARITLTRFTTSYFFLAVLTCLALTVLRAITFVDNSVAVSILRPIQGIPDFGIPIYEKEKLKLCISGGGCADVIDFGTNRRFQFVNNQTFPVEFSGVALRGITRNPIRPAGPIVVDLSYPCVVSLKWLNELLQDNQREDVATLLFNFYLFILSLVTVITESIPHLSAAVLGHVLGSAWAIYRLSSTNTLKYRYLNKIVPFACGGIDLFGTLWDMKIQRAILTVVIHVVALFTFLYMSFVLFNVYRNQTFSRVGAAPKIHRMCTIILIFLCCLQLVNFFYLASTILWLNKMCHNVVTQLPGHFKLYRVAFIVNLVIHYPWFFLGVSSVQTESRFRFTIFITIAMFLFAISTAMFFSSLYRYTFLTWPFFTTLTCTAYALLIATIVLSITCRLNFGKGVAHYFHVTRVLEGIDFTPEYFSKREEGIKEKRLDSLDNSDLSLVRLPLPTHQGHGSKVERESWIYSVHNPFTVQISTTPPLLSDIGPVPPRLAATGWQQALSRKL